MVITTSFAAVDDVLARALGAADTEVLSGSEFADDTRGDAFLLSQVGAFKAAMARGFHSWSANNARISFVDVTD